MAFDTREPSSTCGAVGRGVKSSAPQHHVRLWHIASFRCTAPVRQQLGVKRTCHRHRWIDAIDPLKTSVTVDFPPPGLTICFRAASGPLAMAEQAPQRRLAAILAADVVGYSRMMQADEAGTLATLKARRTEILQPLVSKHHGRIIKVMGDGVLVEFASAVEAVSCAVALHEAMAVANEGAEESRRVVLRIGINLGDVLVEGGDLYGDGVNIAARLESLAEPGGIYVSGKVYHE